MAEGGAPRAVRTPQAAARITPTSSTLRLTGPCEHPLATLTAQIPGDSYGKVHYTLCSLPEGWASRAGMALFRKVIENQFAGHFLPPVQTPWHDCERSFRLRSHIRLTTFVSLRKCCTVGAGVLPTQAMGATS